MAVLALDTALAATSVAFLEEAGPQARLALRAEPMARGHAERLFPLLRATLAEAGARLADIDRFAVTVGPGSFTGVRVGLAAARGLALAAGKPLVGVTTFDALGEALAEAEGVTAGLEALAFAAPRGELFLELRFGGRPLGPPVALSPAAAAAHVAARGKPERLAGSGAGLLARALAAQGGGTVRVCALEAGHAGHVARLAVRAPLPDGPPRPLYLREADAVPARPA
ncbi:MAG: tRNA (adenosine(37)-N6)-threonylcarbamoyltransferase complex dimerization subunit type 1 TsaB [Alphaproteobacteria bacterium]|nr:tRNA (adenosine(37)-N6)-threonylcarbamoyltransferase complex dimerization subunit type 1 TsaB [Alphaproteobacteria bacterium]